jgi:hypothetical protein
VCRLQPQPAEVAESFAQMGRDPTVYYSRECERLGGFQSQSCQ